MPWVKYEIEFHDYRDQSWYTYVTTHSVVKEEDGKWRPWTLEEAREVVRKDKARHRYYARTYDYYKYTKDNTTWFARTKKGAPAPTYDPANKS